MRGRSSSPHWEHNLGQCTRKCLCSGQSHTLQYTHSYGFILIHCTQTYPVLYMFVGTPHTHCAQRMLVLWGHKWKSHIHTQASFLTHVQKVAHTPTTSHTQAQTWTSKHVVYCMWWLWGYVVTPIFKDLNDCKKKKKYSYESHWTPYYLHPLAWFFFSATQEVTSIYREIWGHFRKKQREEAICLQGQDNKGQQLWSEI